MFCENILNGEKALLLVTGSPGTGKSYSAETAEGRLHSNGLGCFGISFMWSAVGKRAVICPRMSVHAILGAVVSTLNVGCPMRGELYDKLATVRARVGDNLCAAFLEEASCLDIPLLVCFPLNMCQLKNRKGPLGGLSIFKMGDFGQISAIGGTSFVAALVTFCISGQPLLSGRMQTLVVTQAAGLFHLFHRLNRTEQVRAGSDEFWCAFIRRFEFSAKEPPIKKEVLDDLFKRKITPEILLRDPEFEDAIYAVQTNRELGLFNTALLMRFAARRGLPIFKWINSVKIGNVSFSRELGNQFYDAGAHELMSYFVQGMPVLISSKQGHVSWKISNGRPGYAHSFPRAPAKGFVMPVSKFQRV